MGKIISVFSHKGGVGKTTFVHNIAFELASRKTKDEETNKERSLKILLIDTDSQMNLTASMLGLSSDIINYDVKENSKWIQEVEKYRSFSDLLKDNDVIPKKKNDILDKPIFNFSQIHKNDKLFEDLSFEIDVLLSNKSTFITERDLQSFSGNRDRPRKFQEAILKIAKNYDYTFIDLSPNANSNMNGLFVFTSDYLIIPVFPEFYSKQAVDNMNTIYLGWKKIFMDDADIQEYGFDNKVKSLGIVIQKARRYGRSGQLSNHRNANHIEEWVKQLNNSICEFQKMRDSSGGIDTSEFQRIFANQEPFVIEKFCDFAGKLKSSSEKYGKGLPVSRLNLIEDKRVKNTLQITQWRQAYEDVVNSYKKVGDALLKL